MARAAITYRGSRRNLVLRGAGMKWGPQFCFEPGGREYQLVPCGKNEAPFRFINNIPHKLVIIRRWAPAMGAELLKNLLFAARMAEQKHGAAAWSRGMEPRHGAAA